MIGLKRWEVPAMDLFQRKVPKLPSNLEKDGAKSISWITRHRSFRNPEWKKFYLAEENPTKKMHFTWSFNVTLKLRVPFLVMVLDELRDFERRTVRLDFIAKKLCLQDYVIVENIFFTANSTAQPWDRPEYRP
jgi:hypothetical protein